MIERPRTLGEILLHIEAADPDLAIYAEDVPRSSVSSLTVVAAEPEDGSLPAEATGLSYLLDVRTAQEVIAVWRQWRDSREPTTRDMVAAVIYYAVHDAYLPA